LPQKHKKPACIEFGFPDYVVAQALKRKARAAKGARVLRTGKTLPAPNAVVAKIAADKVNCEYTINANGAMQTLLLEDGEEAKALAAALKAAKRPTSPDPPCATRYEVLINKEVYLALAKKYDLY
jgi:hypothetical protein